MIVLPDVKRTQPANPMCPTDRDAAFERYLAEDVPNYVRSHFHTATGTNNWTVAGLAADGTYALMLALRHPDIFGNFADLSGVAAPAAPQYRPAWLLQQRAYHATSGWFVAGRDDIAARTTQNRLAALARSAGAQVRVSTVIGARGWTAWHTALQRLLPWVWSRAQSTPPPSASAPRPSASSRLSSGHGPALRHQRSVHRLPQCAPGHRGRGADHRRGYPQRAHRSARVAQAHR
jgi:S-formylglutathione hydrolase FrmB